MLAFQTLQVSPKSEKEFLKKKKKKMLGQGKNILYIPTIVHSIKYNVVATVSVLMASADQNAWLSVCIILSFLIVYYYYFLLFPLLRNKPICDSESVPNRRLKQIKSLL